MKPATDRPPQTLWITAQELVPLAGGARNTVLRTTGLPRDLVFKSTRHSAPAIEWLQDVHDAAERAGLVAPKLIPSKRGNLVENGWTCETFLEGTPLGREDMAALMPSISAFHRATCCLPQRPGMRSSLELCEFASAKDIDLTVLPPDLVKRMRNAWSALEHHEMGVVHGDLTPANALVLMSGRLALLDWDEARRDATVFDLAQLGPQGPDVTKACLAWEIAVCWLVEPQRARQLAEAF